MQKMVRARARVWDDYDDLGIGSTMSPLKSCPLPA